MIRIVCCALLVACCLLDRPALAVETQANMMVEIPFTASQTYTDPFNQVTFDVTFTDPAGHEMRVPAFWDGKNVWKVRYASPIVGTHTYRTEFADAGDTGLHGITGSVEIKPYTGQNPLYIHGPLHVSANKRYLEHFDGKPFFWLGDTWWMGLCHRLHWPDEVHTLVEDRKAKGFTVIQIVAGLYPDMYPFDPRGANEAGFPWEKDYTAIRPEYFDEADKRIEYLADQGFTPCIVGAWGYFMEWMGPKKLEQHWRYLIARYGALPVVWCAAGEANLDWYRDKNFPFDDRPQVTQWTEVMKYMHATDPYHHPITVHPTGLGRWSSRHATDDPNLLDFDMLQTPHGERDAVPITMNTIRQSYPDTPRMPVIDGEAAYEMLGGMIHTEWSRRMFWLCMCNGAAGHTYGANGIWQCNREGQPHGPSPTVGSPPQGYGATPWNEAMNFPGSKQVGLGKALFEQFDWWKFEPHPEWVTFANQPTLSFEKSNWIWFPEGDPSKNAPAEKRYFRRTFTVPPDKSIASAQLRLSADDRFNASLNGEAIGGLSQYEGWKFGKQFDGIAAKLKPGVNLLAVQAENVAVPSANPAGLIAILQINFTDGGSMTIASDDHWRSAKQETAGWDKSDFDDTNWSKAMIVTPYGGAPWGKIDPASTDPIFGPQATGIAGVVRLIYVPDPRPIELNGLEKSASYTTTLFDPVTGEKRKLDAIQADDAGKAKCDSPSGIDHDWVVILESKH